MLGPPARRPWLKAVAGPPKIAAQRPCMARPNRRSDADAQRRPNKTTGRSRPVGGRRLRPDGFHKPGKAHDAVQNSTADIENARHRRPQRRDAPFPSVFFFATDGSPKAETDLIRFCLAWTSGGCLSPYDLVSMHFCCEVSRVSFEIGDHFLVFGHSNFYC